MSQPQPDAVEQEIQAKGLTAPRVTPADIEAAIASEHYAVASDMFGVSVSVAHPGGENYPSQLKLLTFCVLVLRNGFTVTGESACASPENFDAELGRKIARQAAFNKVWPLLGFELKTRLSQQQPAQPAAPASNGLGPFGGHCSNQCCSSPKQCKKQGQCRYAP